MAYAVRNFKTKKALKDAHARGDVIEVFQPGPFGPEVEVPREGGTIFLEGPHYPVPHRWYALVAVQNGVIVPGSKIK